MKVVKLNEDQSTVERYIVGLKCDITEIYAAKDNN